jgi:1-acyl-sn-glycerol-3-phosphate acyltransferase
VAKEKRSIFDIIAIYTIVAIFKLTFGLYLRIKFNVKIEKNEARRIKGGYFILANHTHNMDGCFVQYYWKRMVCFVVNDTVWKVKGIRGLLDMGGFIPIRKNTTDSTAVRKIFSRIKQNRIVGIFPEGTRSWGGVTVPMVTSTAALIKKLKVPLVTIKIKGAMMSKPRWSYVPRRGKITLVPKIALDAEKISEMSVSEISDVINKELYHDEHVYLSQNKDIVFNNKKSAECLELFLFACKDCGALAKMKSKGQAFYCLKCGSRYHFENDCSLKRIDGKTTTLMAWDEHQKRLLENWSKDQADDYVLFSDVNVTLFAYIRNQPLKMLAKGKLDMTPKAMVLSGEEKHVFEVEKLSAINMQRNDQIEFTYENATYRFLFEKGISPYKWEIAALSAK